jgi:hypothetical protein
MTAFTATLLLIWLHVIKNSNVPDKVLLRGLPLMMVPGINVILLLVTMKKALKLR